MKKINVSLYGGSVKGNPLRKETIYCEHADTCSLFKEGKCLNCAALNRYTAGCPVGRVEHTRGYTTRSVKYDDFKHSATTDEVYSKLTYPAECDFAILGDGSLFFNLRYVKVWKPISEYDEYDINGCRYRMNENGYAISDKGFGNAFLRIPKEEITLDFLNWILIYDSCIINELYQEKSVPNILHEMRKLVPELYKELTTAYPALVDKAPDFRGRVAYVMSLRDGLEIVDGGTKGVKQGNKIIVEKFTNSLLPFGCRSAKLELPIDENTVVKIADNTWVDDNTRFK